MNNSILYPNTENGIYIYDYPEINGIKQYVQIRGASRKNPLMLFLHGGPGSSVAGVCHILQQGWEEKFTVVNWDQRNTCKTYFANKDRAKEISETGTIEDYVSDIDGIIAYLHTVYDFDKLVLVGFSWGSAIGSEYAKCHPENILCYISVGQLVNYREGLLFTCNKLLNLVPKGSKDEAKVKKIIDEFPESPVWNKEFTGFLKYFMPICTKYITAHAKPIPFGKILKSPFMNFREKKATLLPDTSVLTKSYATMLSYDFRNNMEYNVPVLFISGDEETVCSFELIEECFDKISAPKKKFAVIPQATHSCFYDQPQAFWDTLISFVG